MAGLRPARGEQRCDSQAPETLPNALAIASAARLHRAKRGHPWPLCVTLLLCARCVTLLSSAPGPLRARFIGESIHDPLDPGFHRGCAKVQQQSNSVISEAQVRLKLLDVNGRQRFHRLHLDEDAAIDHQIGAVPAVDRHSLLDQRHGLLALEFKSCLGHLVLEAGEICALEHAGAKSTVDSYCGIEHARCQSIQRCCSRRWGHADNPAARMPE